MVNESRFAHGKISALSVSKWVWVRVVLFRKGHGHPQEDANLNFFPSSKNSLSGLSNEASFVSGFSLEMWLKEVECLTENQGVSKLICQDQCNYSMEK